MSATPEKNAAERRIDLLREHHRAFIALPRARLLCLCVTRDEAPMVDAFVELESDERTGEIRDLFVRFEEPFDDPAAYGFALRDALLEQYEGSREQMEDSGVDVAWKCPTLGARPREGGGASAGIQALLECGASLCDHYADLFDHLVLVLRPERLSDAAAFRRWLAEAAAGAAPWAVRFIVLDDRASPSIAALAVSDPAHVRVAAANLDMPGAVEELSAAAGHLDSPGGMFRHLFVKLSRAAAEGNVAAAQSLGDEAIKIAQESGWHHLTALVHFALGAALAARGEAPGAIHHYKQAGAHAERAALAGEPSAPIIRVNAHMGTGVALFSAGAFDKAADVYEEAAALAEAAQNPLLRLLQMECRRMAGYSHERAGARERSWAAGMEALRIGSQMSEEERAGSTLAYAGEGLLRVARRGSGDAKLVDEQMTTLLGPDWRPKAPPKEQPS